MVQTDAFYSLYRPQPKVCRRACWPKSGSPDCTSCTVLTTRFTRRPDGAAVLPLLAPRKSEPRRAGQTIETRGQTRAGKTAWRKRIGNPMEQPSQIRQRTKKPEPATGPIPRKAKRGNHAEQNRTTMAQSFRRTCRLTRSCSFFARAQRQS